MLILVVLIVLAVLAPQLLRNAAGLFGLLVVAVLIMVFWTGGKEYLQEKKTRQLQAAAEAKSRAEEERVFDQCKCLGFSGAEVVSYVERCVQEGRMTIMPAEDKFSHPIYFVPLCWYGTLSASERLDFCAILAAYPSARTNANLNLLQWLNEQGWSPNFEIIYVYPENMDRFRNPPSRYPSWQLDRFGSRDRPHFSSKAGSARPILSLEPMISITEDYNARCR